MEFSLKSPLFAAAAALQTPSSYLYPQSLHVLCCCSKPPSLSFSSLHRKIKCRREMLQKPKSLSQGEQQGLGSKKAEDERDKEEEQLNVLTSMSSNFNDIIILDTPKSRFLLLDHTHNVHSMFNKGNKWTDSYWDDFASLPAIIPQGPIAILGLGGGTCAHLMLDLWPSLKLEGWEIDEILIDKAREYLGLSDLEKSTPAGGVLSVHIGDALSPSAVVPGGFAGIVVDLFAGGAVLPQLSEVTTWLELNNKLMPHGRIMVNCGGAHSKATDVNAEKSDPMLSSKGEWVQNSTVKALCKAFPGKLSWKKLGNEEGENYLALTGPLPDLDMWSTSVPEKLSLNVKQWKPCGFSDQNIYGKQKTNGGDCQQQTGYAGCAVEQAAFSLSRTTQSFLKLTVVFYLMEVAVSRSSSVLQISKADRL